MTFSIRDWKDRPSELDPLPGETLAQWEARATIYIAAHPTLVTVINAAAMEDLEGRLSAYTDTARPTWRPSDNGLLAATRDPGEANDQVETQNGEILWAKVWLPASITIANLVVWVSSPGSGFSTGNYGELYSLAGTLIAKTAEQSTPWATAGKKTMALTAESGQSLTQGGAGIYGLFGVMSRATSRPLFRCKLVDENVNLNLTGLGLRSGQDSSSPARTTPPATLVAGNQGPTFNELWVGVT